MTAGITALLGPTNTGKTHHAIERMLEHPSGMIGLPLRLLAREVYDKVTARVGESRVALVTGEEQRIQRERRRERIACRGTAKAAEPAVPALIREQALQIGLDRSRRIERQLQPVRPAQTRQCARDDQA